MFHRIEILAHIKHTLIKFVTTQFPEKRLFFSLYMYFFFFFNFSSELRKLRFLPIITPAPSECSMEFFPAQHFYGTSQKSPDRSLSRKRLYSSSRKRKLRKKKQLKSVFSQVPAVKNFDGTGNFFECGGKKKKKPNFETRRLGTQNLHGAGARFCLKRCWHLVFLDQMFWYIRTCFVKRN